MSERSEKLSKGGFNAQELEEASFPELVEAWTHAEGTVKTRIKRHLMNEVARTPILFYPGYRSGFPYQEKADRKRSITLFQTEKDAEEHYMYSDVWPSERGAFIQTLGFNGKEIVPIMEQIGFYGIDEVLVPGEAGSGTIFSCSVDDLRLVFDPECRPSASQTRKNIGRMEEALLREVPDEDLIPIQSEAFLSASRETLWLPLKNGKPLLYEKAIEVYTDPAELVLILDDSEHDTEETVSWNRIAGYGTEVSINRFLRVDPETVRQIDSFTDTGNNAYLAICFAYGLDWQSETDRKTADQIFDDIQDAAPVMEELLRSLTASDEENGEIAIGIDPPENNAVEVKEITAHMLVDSGYCKDAVRAYHVLSLLYNDPQGENWDKFENAELFE